MLRWKPKADKDNPNHVGSEDMTPRTTASLARDQTNKFLAVCVIVVGVLITGALTFYAITNTQVYDIGKKGVSTTLTNRQNGKNITSLECANYEASHPGQVPTLCVGIPPLKVIVTEK